MKYLEMLREKDPSSALAYHLDGLLEAARNVEGWLEKLGELPELNEEDIATTLIYLDVEVYSHLLYHMKELRHPLRRREKALFADYFRITRVDSTEASRAPILLAEIDRLLKSDPELALSSTHFYDRQVEGERTERVAGILWSAHSPETLLWLRAGDILAKSPDDATILKMIEIAEKLQARVIGEEEEVYVATSAPPGWKACSSEGHLPE